jgi:hypothetical protein
MPSRYLIVVELDRPDRVQAEHVHALMSECLERRLPTAGQFGHRANVKGYSISPPCAWDDHATGFEVGIVHDPFEPVLLDALAQMPVHLGDQDCRVRQMEQGPARLMRRAPWTQLLADAIPRRDFRFEFVTPTVFRRGSSSVDGRRRGQVNTPLPIPKLVLGHYLETWLACDPGGLLAEFDLDAIDPFLSWVELSSCWYRMTGDRKPPDQLGFVGRATLSLHRTSAMVHRALDALASLSFYSGTGSGTPWGMGVTRYLGGRP